MRITRVALAIAGACVVSAQGSYVEYNGHSYAFVTAASPTSWTAARDAAAAMTYQGVNGYLATITSQEELAFITANLSYPADGKYHADWIGGYRVSNSSDPNVGWNWVTGEPWDFTKWSGHQPDNGGANGENYLEILPDGTWNNAYLDPSLDGSHWDVTRSIVEFNATAVPEPATTVGGIVALGITGFGLSRRRSTRKTA